MNNYLLIQDSGLEALARSVVAILIVPETITEVPYGLSAVLVAPNDTTESELMSLYQNNYYGDAYGVVELTGDWQADFENQCANYVAPTP
jgi:hypothetical protein